MSHLGHQLSQFSRILAYQARPLPVRVWVSGSPTLFFYLSPGAAAKALYLAWRWAF